MALKIPKEHRTSLLELAQLAPETFEKLLGSIEKLRPKQSLVELRGRLVSVLPIPDVAKRRALAETLVSMNASMLRSEMSVGQFVEDLVDGVSESDATEADRKSISERLDRILQVSALRLSAKATVLRVDHDRVYNASRIVTDLRPVFDEAVGDGFRGVMLIHQLKMVSLRRGEPEELFFAMDDQDLASLKKTIDRAELKSEQIRKLLVNKNLSQFDGEYDS